MCATVDHIIGQMRMGQMGVMAVAIKGKLQHFHTGQIKVVFKRDYLISNHTEIFRNHGQAWTSWPLQERHRDTDVLQTVREELASVIAQTLFEQFVFFTQWHEIREYAKQHDVELFGDMPIFVAADSADVWAHHREWPAHRSC